MNSIKNEVVVYLGKNLSQLCWLMAGGFREVGEEAAVVVVRAIKENPNATAEDLQKSWTEELAVPPNEAVIEQALELHALLGPEWNVVYLNRYLLEDNDEYRGEGETREDCPLFGDTIEEVQYYWQRISNEFDAKRAKEEEAASALLNRQARKAA